MDSRGGLVVDGVVPVPVKELPGPGPNVRMTLAGVVGGGVTSM